MSWTKSELSQVALLCLRLGGRAITQRANMLLALTLLVCATATSSLGFFAKGAQDALDRDISNFLGAPLVVRNTQPISSTYWETAGLSPVETIAFTTGALGKNGYRSLSLKAVSAGYPLQGSLLLKRDGSEQSYTSQARPKEGEAWLDQQALSVLGLKVGDTFLLGRQTFVVNAELVAEPDRLTQLQYILPRVMIRVEDLSGVGLNVKSGRGEFRYLFKDSESQLNRIKQQLSETLHQPYEILEPRSGSHPFARVAQRVEKMLGLVAVLVMLLCGVACALLAGHSVQRYAAPSAVLRCWGLNPRVLLLALLCQLFVLAFAATCCGYFLGWAVQPLLAQLLEPHLVLASTTFSLATLDIDIFISNFALAAAVILAFVLPKLSALSHVSVMSVFRGQASYSHRLWLSAILVSVCVSLLLWYYSDNIQLTLILAIGVVLMVTLSLAMGWLLSKICGESHRLFRGSLRVSTRAIGRSPKRYITLLSTLSLVTMVFLLTAVLHGRFVDTYQVQRLVHDGNYFFSHLPEKQKESFTSLVEENGAELKGLYPMLEAKLQAINGVAFEQALSRESESREELRSVVRLSWAEALPANNRLIEGEWPSRKRQTVSVEAEVMEDLGLSLGDELSFAVGDKTLNFVIGSAREFKGGHSKVMFWFMFAPETLAHLPHSYMGGVHINDSSHSALAAIAEAFPDVVITDLERHIQRIRGLIKAVTSTVRAIIMVLLVAAVMVLLACALTFASARRRQCMLMYSLGMSKNRIAVMILSEYALLGAMASIVGVVGAQLVADAIFKYQFAMSYAFSAGQYGLVILVTVIGFALVGCITGVRNMGAQLSRVPLS